MKTNGYGRALPPILRAGETAESWPERRAELMTLLREQVYGFSPEETPVVTVESEEEKPCFAGKANLGRVVLRVQFGEKSFFFPVRYAFPKAKRPALSVTASALSEAPAWLYICIFSARPG